MSEWREVAIGEVTDELHDGPHATPPAADSGPVYLGIKNLTDGGSLDLSTIRHIADEDFPRWTKRATPRPGDIVFTYEATLHRYALIPEGFEGCLGRRLALIRPRAERVDSKFLHLALLGPEWRQTVEERTLSGATVDRIPITDFPSFPLSLPSLPIQRRIAAVLSAFDELIEINERRIELLEDLARSLYREWLVHFRFPGHEDVEMVDSELGPIPEGWEIATLSDLADVVVDGVEPSDVTEHERYVGLEHLPRRRTTLREWGRLAEVKSRKLLFREGDTLFGKIRPYFHKVVWAPFSGATSSDTIVIRATGPAASPALVNSIASSDAVVAEAVATSNGTKMPRADPKALLARKMPLPGEVLRGEFEATTRPLLLWCAGLTRQNRALAATRDLLLPRLVTGRLDISEVDLGVLTPTQVE